MASIFAPPGDYVVGRGDDFRHRSTSYYDTPLERPSGYERDTP